MKSLNYFGVLGLLMMALGIAIPASALDSHYMRNGECYMMIGEGSAALKGIYRLNNPEKELYYDPAKQVITDLNDSISFNVDLYRNIYTFTEKTDSSWQNSTGYLYRQVLDSSNGVTADLADYGYHSYIHYDYRTWGANTDIYRTGPVGRKIKMDGSYNAGTGTEKWWPTGSNGFVSAGPGTPASKPAGYTLPDISGAGSYGEQSGKQWYKIPNASWYSVWKTGEGYPWTTNQGFDYFYFVFGDKEQYKAHKYYLYTHVPNDETLDKPDYSSNSGAMVAQSNETKVSRDILAGCLDGCGGASGSGTGQAAVMLSDIAFQPPVSGNVARTYFYTRPEGSGNYSVTLNNDTYNPANNPLIGLPGSTDTFWIGISLKNKTSDFVYCLGNSVIKDWYTQATGQSANSLNITATTVSNQWDQEGGVVYAYDKSNKKIYKFERKETEGTPITRERYLALDLRSILNTIGANENSELDDIKADGFGSCFFALSHPSKNVNEYNPPAHFRPNDCMHIHKGTVDSSRGEVSFKMQYCQEYGKVVFERNYYTGDIKEIGRKNYATRYYTVSGKIKQAGWNQLEAIKDSLPSGQLQGILASWSATVAGYTYRSDWPASYYVYGICCSSYSELNYTNPGNCKLAVINVPTPPRLISLGGKKSYLDICGPYKESFPVADKTTRSTDQGDGLLGTGGNIPTLEPDKIYFYMVENYPIDDGAQDPTAQPDWDGDGRQGGFVTSISNPAPMSNDPSGSVGYEWKLWTVQDAHSNNVCLNNRTVDFDTGKPYNFFYSPLGGKFIMTCRVKYDWYDYDSLAFGSTIDDLGSVLHSGELALPVTSGSISHNNASTRLNQIMNMPQFSFMRNAKDKNGNNIDYNEIIAGGEYLALEPIICSGDPPPPATGTYITAVSRCDVLPGVATDTNTSYVNLSSYWSPTSSEGYHGIESGMSYNWRIDVASQAALFRDISQNNISDLNNPNFNIAVHKMLNDHCPIPAGSKLRFQNNVGDVRWADDKIEVTAFLEYKVPKLDGTAEVKKIFLISDDNADTAGEPKVFTVKPETTIWQNNNPIFTSTLGDLPPTDPEDATLVIQMKRQYEYDTWSYADGTAEFHVGFQPDWVTIEGRANVKIIDTTKPKIDYDETSPMNLFATTGGKLQTGVGPSGMTNPSTLYFGMTDNNPWEAVRSNKGLSLEEHIRNLAYNYGYSYVLNYCSSNETLSSVFDRVMNEISGYTGIQRQIQEAKDAGTKSSHLNYKPVFSLYARDVRFSFQSAKRNTTEDTSFGTMTVGKADEIYPNTTGRNFSKNDSNYALHYHNNDGSEHSNYVTIANESPFQTVGYTTKYQAYVKYKIALANVKLGMNNDNTVPDGYANNTPGYATYNSDGSLKKINPYKFYVSFTDSSGNYTGEKELNMALHVKDDIPPVGYGVFSEFKDNNSSVFPFRTAYSASYPTAPGLTPEYGALIDSVSGTYGSSIHADLIKSAAWTPDSTANGYVNGVNVPGTGYQAMKSFGTEVKTGLGNDSVFAAQVAAGLAPCPTEDNVEGSLSVFVSDNAGSAVATLTYTYLSSDGRGQAQEAITRTISSSFGSSAETNGTIASSTMTIHTLFRGKGDQFPMAIPITIVAQDNARDWDYYNGGSADEDGDWHWGTIYKGANVSLKRTFKTSIPVYGSNLSIRTLDKTIKNE